MGEPHALARVAIVRRHSAGIAPVCGRSSGSEKGQRKKRRGGATGGRRPPETILAAAKKILFRAIEFPRNVAHVLQFTDPIGSLVRQGVTPQLPVILTLF